MLLIKMLKSQGHPRQTHDSQNSSCSAHPLPASVLKLPAPSLQNFPNKIKGPSFKTFLLQDTYPFRAPPVRPPPPTPCLSCLPFQPNIEFQSIPANVESVSRAVPSL